MLMLIDIDYQVARQEELNKGKKMIIIGKFDRAVLYFVTKTVLSKKNTVFM